MVSNRQTFYMSSLQGGCGKSLNDEMGVYAAERRHHDKPVRTPSNLGNFFVQSLAKSVPRPTSGNNEIHAWARSSPLLEIECMLKLTMTISSYFGSKS